MPTAQVIAKDNQGWPELREWGEVDVLDVLNGTRNHVLLIRIGGHRFIARRSRRALQALEWELTLRHMLHHRGLQVPLPIPTVSGELHAGKVTVEPFLEGRPPHSLRDWQAVRETLQQVHETTEGWPQRPGFRSCLDLCVHDRGGDVDLTTMPPDVVIQLRRAWQALYGERCSVIHGDPGRSNVLMTGGSAALIDWDEARVDVPLLDLADLPLALADLDAERVHAARQAAHAWEAANAWLLEPEYARRRLAQLDR